MSRRCFCLPYFGIEGGAASRGIAIGYFDGTIPSEYSQLRPTTACLAEYDYSLIWIPALVSHNLPPLIICKFTSTFLFYSPIFIRRRRLGSECKISYA